MDNVISEYQKWKLHGESLRAQAKQAMESRFRDLLLEAAQVAQEYHADFGVSLKPPPNITTFRYKSVAGRKAKKAKAEAVAKRGEPAAERAGVAPNPKIPGLRKRREQIQKKLDAAKSAGKATKNLEDRLYEVEDELRLAGEGS